MGTAAEVFERADGGVLLIDEAYSPAAITVGVTTALDLAWWIRQRFADLGVAAWFQPTVGLQRAGVRFRPRLVDAEGHRVRFIDGGTVDNLPVDFTATLGVDAVIAVDVGSSQDVRRPPARAAGFAAIFMRAATTMIGEYWLSKRRSM